MRVDATLEAGAPEADVKAAKEAATLLLGLPWELLHDGKSYLFQGAKPTRLRRWLPGIEGFGVPVVATPIRILLVTARPEDDARAYKYQSTSTNKDSPGLWTCEVDTLITSGISSFVNHKSSQNELLFQGAKNNLYLTSATGNIIWKKNIGEKSLSPFYTVDAFKNNKYQILFNTSTHLHLIDRNGNYVPGYPLKLPASATNPLSLQDYDKTKDYRIIIACADNKIYNYYINGTKNDKFTPIRT